MKNLDVPFAVEFKGITFAVTSIGKEAFKECRTLVTASLGNVTAIGVKAFSGCTKLNTVDTGESLKTVSAYGFYGCKNLVNFDVEDSAKTIRSYGHYAFAYCNSLSQVSIPSYMTDLGDADEPTFKRLVFADENGNAIEVNSETIGEVRGYRYVKNSEGVYVRDVGVFVGKEYSDGVLKYRVIATLPAELEVAGPVGTVRNLVVPETAFFDDCRFVVSAIGENAFNGSTKLKTADLGHVQTVKKQAFYACENLVTADMPYVTAIGIKAFANCVDMTDPGFGDRLKTISAYAFYRCRSLASVDLPDTVTSLGSYSFYKCTGLKEIDLGASLKVLGSYAVSKTHVEKVVLPSTIVKVCSSSLSGNPDLKVVVIGGEKTKILHCVLQDCPSIEMIVMPTDISKLYADSFDGYVFTDESGKVLSQTRKVLRNHVFVGAEGQLAKDDLFTVTFAADPQKAATFAVKSVDVPYGTPIVVSDLDLYVDNVIVLLEPASGYVQTGWDAPGMVEGDVTVTAHFAAA
jgi:hypothetical protein